MNKLSRYWTLCLVDGGFSDWEEWSACSATCGGGKRQRTRTCNNPAPYGSGNDCVGVAEEEETCNDDECPGNLIFVK